MYIYTYILTATIVFITLKNQIIYMSKIRYTENDSMVLHFYVMDVNIVIWAHVCVGSMLLRAQEEQFFSRSII